MTLFNHDISALAKKTVHEILDDNILGLSAETAYSFLFGLFPLFLFAAPLLSLFGDQTKFFNDTLARLAPNVPPAALDLVRSVLHDVVFTKNAPGLMSIGALLSLWAGAGLFSSLMSALNVAYDITETRPWWKQKLIAVTCAIGAVLILWSATIAMVAGEYIVNELTTILHLSVISAILLSIAQYVLAALLVVAFIWMLYLILPNLRLGARATLPGALFAAAFWAIFTSIFRIYVTNFGAYNKTYGTIGAVIILLTWMYWTMFALLAGGELNSELHAGTGAISRAQKLPHPPAQPQ